MTTTTHDDEKVVEVWLHQRGREPRLVNVLISKKHGDLTTKGE